MAKKPVVLEIVEQGIYRKMSFDEARAFIKEEQRIIGEIASLVATQFSLFNLNVHANSFHHTASQELAQIDSALEREVGNAFDAYQDRARRCEVIVGQGTIWNAAREVHQRGFATQARLQVLMNAVGWLEGNTREHLQQLRAAAFANPATLGAQDILSAKQAEKLACDARDQSALARDEFDAYTEEKRAEVDKLEQLYRDKLTLEAPARLWRKSQDLKKKSWLGWFSLFAVLALLPIIGAAVYSEQLTAFVVHVTAANTGGVSLGGVAAITVPALFYAWLLKNVSRLFIQAHTLADDAAH